MLVIELERELKIHKKEKKKKRKKKKHIYEFQFFFFSFLTEMMFSGVKIYVDEDVLSKYDILMEFSVVWKHFFL